MSEPNRSGNNGIFDPADGSPANQRIEDAASPETRAPLPEASLIECFREWASAYGAMQAWRDGAALLLDAAGKRLARAGLLAAEREGELASCGELALRSGMESSAGRSADVVLAAPIAERADAAPFAALAVALEAGPLPAERTAAARAAMRHFASAARAAAGRAQLAQAVERERSTAKDLRRKDELFRATKRLHDQIDVPSVLIETIETLGRLYPGSEADLYLSQDYTSVDARVKPLVFRNERGDISAKAFLEGKPVAERAEERDVFRLAVPMAGKQAVYGVLLLTMPASQWDETDMEAFGLLADTAGSAFENAKLYEQSNFLIGELQLINELTKRLNQSLRLKEIFQFATSELLQVFNADFCCVLQLSRETNEFVVMSSNIPSLVGDRFSSEYGFCGVVFRSKESLIISDYKDSEHIASKLMQTTSSRSLIASPIMVESQVGGVILVAHRLANYFSYDNYKLLQVMSTHIGLAITNASLHAEVRRMVITDNLTGLHARHYLDEQIQSRQRVDGCGSLILVDIDFFKRVNDTYGHQIGDRILVKVSSVVRSCIRDSDIAARWGGEELAVYLPKVRTDQAYRIAERIRQTVESETDPTVTVSCGVSEWTEEDEKISSESLFYRADMALYEAKHRGRNQVMVG